MWHQRGDFSQCEHAVGGAVPSAAEQISVRTSEASWALWGLGRKFKERPGPVVACRMEQGYEAGSGGRACASGKLIVQ